MLEPVDEHYGAVGRITDSSEGSGRGTDRSIFDSVGTDGRSTLAEMHGEVVGYSARGPGDKGEEGSLDVCRALVTRLNRDGASWAAPRDISAGVRSPHPDADCLAQDGAEQLLIQVTRPPDQPFWASLNRRQYAAGVANVEAAARTLRSAVECKMIIPSAQRPRLTLALNAQRMPSHAFPSVIRAFRAEHGSWAMSLGFAGIWVVGLSDKLVARLDYAGPYADTW